MSIFLFLSRINTHSAGDSSVKYNSISFPLRPSLFLNHRLIDPIFSLTPLRQNHSRTLILLFHWVLQLTLPDTCLKNTF